MGKLEFIVLSYLDVHHNCMVNTVSMNVIVLERNHVTKLLESVKVAAKMDGMERSVPSKHMLILLKVNYKQTSIYGIKGTTVFHNGTCEKMNISMASDKAVDGNFDPGITHKSCASTDWEKYPYWQVMFDKPYTISQLRIYNRMGNNRKRLYGFKVSVGSSLCFQSQGYEYDKDVIHIKCSKQLTANSVRISLDGDRRMLTLCEVEVLQCVPGFYGEMCKKRCELCEGSECDQVTGRCEKGCIIGYYVPYGSQKCTECISGNFGRNCTKSCHCSLTCNHINGSCPGDCHAGYTGSNCQEECKDGRFGSNCRGTCHCINNKKCDRRNGTCSDGCSAGYRGTFCQQKCLSGRFGPECTKFCHCSETCNHINGLCPGVCEAGYTGYNCQKECEVGRFGSNCTGTCHCINNKKCDRITGKCSDGCSAGYTGSFCQKKCPNGSFGHNCNESCHCSVACNRINGSCPGECDNGYTGFKCQKECEVGRFGRNCKRTCHCIDNESCNRVNGSCEGGCSDGYLGFDCQEECPNGSLGHNCNESCHCSVACNRINGSCPGECDNGYTGFKCQKECSSGSFGHSCIKDCHCSLTCDHVHGSCPGDCDAGYSGSSCQEECEGDKFGVNCIDICHCVDNKKCDRRNGTCPNGCAAGYEGDNCQQECSNDRFGLGCNVSCRCSEKCNNINGSCPGTCDEGYHGFNCQKEKSAQSILVFVLVPLLLFILLIIGLVTAIWYWKFRGKRPIAKRDQKIRKIPENKYAGAIPEDTAHLCEEIQLNETESIYVNIANTSFKSNLQKYVSEKKQEVEPFNDEFLRLPKTLPLPYTEATKPENTKKNRYKTILPYDHSRVRLQPDEISSSDYINANFISNQRYIACQGPTQNTVTDFWRMVWQLKCNTIVMLTDIVENGKMKCIQYWPDEESIESFGTIKVTHINTRSHATYIHRSFTISKSGGHQNERWTIDHFFFSKWPDHGIPQYTEDILEFRNTVRFREGTTSSLVVHCSAGVGRTGTYICIDILLNEMLSGEAIDVLACVTKLREERMHMVQKRIQLEFIYDVLVENILTGDYDIDVNNIPREFSRITETDHSTRVSILEHQFQDVIKQVEVRDTNLALKEGGEYANLNMSGVFIDGSSCEKEFLLTKSPKRNGALEFLMCMRKRGYLNIVAFDSSEETPTYLPRTLNETVKIGPYLLELINVEDKDVCIHSVLKVECDNKSRIEEFEINHFQVTIWADGNYPSSAEILKLSDILSAHQNEQFNKKIAVHCSDKFHKSGLLCIIHILKDAITSQSVINIVRLVRLIKKIEPNIIPDCESYAFIWKVAEYIQNESSLYSNFVQ
ncbi:uncharacterized protein LOC115219456 isoform X3 [Octopus sinensis]|uniref:protein-tyrosine-phosphatase n=1 Tax=Octopus sinensis TaxID=2607531 RepID=A0A7E6FCE8_9MOLL|nr:uncharacterized protein LOC115219456 isoform X3 [Octopus sinensis]